ncbi:MAG: hypothetical protein MOB07_28760 [Acidobacteria bacterium]|nr:hypothetical protein [Acidobacteriota bacterium]
MKQILFFALKDDLTSVIEVVEANIQIKYVQMGVFDTPETETFLSGFELPNLGKADSDSASTCMSYLVCRRDTPVNVRSFEDMDGVSRFFVDQLSNPDTVVFTPAGLWDDDTLLHGRVATLSESELSQEIMKVFGAAFRRKFTKLKAFFVGPKALTLLQSGKRLTISAQSPREFDLSPDP